MEAKGKADIGIIGGTGVYDPGLMKDAETIDVQTRYGKPSGPITIGTYANKRVAILPRHGPEHTIPPHMINFRANIQALSELGVSAVLASAAVGSLKEGYRPGDAVVPDQFINMGRSVHTFFEGPEVRHISMADPFCQSLRSALMGACEAAGITARDKGTYLRIDGPQFSTRAASKLYRQFADIIGMTVVPEAILCREKGMCFACLAMVTDYDVWAEKPVSISEVRKVMAQNSENIKNVLALAVEGGLDKRECGCADAPKEA